MKITLLFDIASNDILRYKIYTNVVVIEILASPYKLYSRVIQRPGVKWFLKCSILASILQIHDILTTGKFGELTRFEHLVKESLAISQKIISCKY